ncbi:MAG: hypothetical protein P8X74_04350 [Reinekea sp.]
MSGLLDLSANDCIPISRMSRFDHTDTPLVNKLGIADGILLHREKANS